MPTAEKKQKKRPGKTRPFFTAIVYLLCQVIQQSIASSRSAQKGPGLSAIKITILFINPVIVSNL
jgi:hypothetical protein